MHFHEVDVNKKRLVRFGRRVEEFQCSLFHVTVKERNTDNALLAINDRCIHILAINLEFFDGLLARLAGQCALGHFSEHCAGFRVHVREPFRVGIGIGIEVIQADVLHHVIALGIGQGVVGFAQVPLAGEVGVIAAGFQHRCQGPFGRWQTTALALEGHGGHAAAVGNTPGLHGRAARCAAGLGIEREKGFAVFGHLVDVRRRHAAALAAAVRAEVAVTGVVGDNKQNVGFIRLRLDNAVCRY
ncbi:hypothetical protein D3C75_805630 [compost metagenome]